MACAAALTFSACAIRGPAVEDLVRADLEQSRHYPGLKAFPGLYEITRIETVNQREPTDKVVVAEAAVTVTLVKDVADWIRDDSAGGLGEAGFDAYKKFRSAKAGEVFDTLIEYRLEHGEQGWRVVSK